MKYMLLYEAFDSDALSKLIKFVKSKLGKRYSNNFINDLKRLINRYDIPIDKISNENIKYLGSKAALKVKPEPVDNKWGVYAIKYWFSLSEGYKGFSGIGNEEFDYNSYKDYRDLDRVKFTKKEIDYIKNKLEIKTGELIPLNKGQYLNDINNGDLVVGMFSDYSDKNNIALAKILIEDEHMYALQNVVAGSEPYAGYRQFTNNDPRFRYSWSLGTNGEGNDHMKLHKYVENNEELKTTYEINDNSKEKSLYDFNLPFDGSTLTEWRYGNISERQIEESDFCIILYFDDILKKGFKKTTQVKKEREESREDALKLMSDEEIKNLNINRYFTELVKRTGVVKKDFDELKDLQKFVKKCIVGKWAFFSIYKNEPEYDNIHYFASEIRNYINENDEYYLVRLIEQYKRMSKLNIELKDLYTKSDSEFRKIENNSKDLVKIYNILIEIGEEIYDWISSKKINTIGDLKDVYHKFTYIRKIIHDDDLKIINFVNFLSYFKYKDEMIDYSRRLSDRDLTEDLKRAKNLKTKINLALT